MNDPNTKYESTANNSEASREEPVLFFNYHEYLTKNYEPLGPFSGEAPVKAIVVNHFLNTHVPVGSYKRATTRLVRLPRAYHTIEQSDIIPQFSTDFPGHEPAAMVSETSKFEPVGRYDGNVFGSTSITPLVPQLIAADELRKIVEAVNGFLLEAFTPFSWQNAIESLLDVATGTLYSKIVFQFTDPYSKRVISKLEQFIEETNSKYTDIEFISPRRTGFTSVSITERKSFFLRPCY